jgi:hypothetical protein
MLVLHVLTAGEEIVEHGNLGGVARKFALPGLAISHKVSRRGNQNGVSNSLSGTELLNFSVASGFMTVLFSPFVFIVELLFAPEGHRGHLVGSESTSLIRADFVTPAHGFGGIGFTNECTVSPLQIGNGEL